MASVTHRRLSHISRATCTRTGGPCAYRYSHRTVDYFAKRRVAGRAHGSHAHATNTASCVPSLNPWRLLGCPWGGALSCIIAAEEPPPALVLLAPYLSMPRSIRIAASTYRLWAPLIPYVSGRGEASVRDPRERALSLSPGYTTGRLLRELNKVAVRAQAALPSITSPTLVVHSREDNRIPVDAALRSYALLGAPEKELVWRDRTGHVITVDFGRDELFHLVEKWLDRHVPASVPRR
jgi:alpha-beta hydrolase superfamily lysophospholipase